MSATYASVPRDARSAWISPFQFEPSSGGLGVTLSATTTSGTNSRIALVGDGRVIRVKVSIDGDACLALGTSSIVATTDYMELLAGTVECFTLKDGDTITHAAVITRSGSTTVHITRGNGG